MWSHLKSALEGSSFSLPDSDSLQTDICGPGYRYMSDGRLVLESKDDMKKRGMPSPDEGDAVALCSANPAARPWSQTATSTGRWSTRRWGWLK
ncbi:hypothetical protein IVB41_25210 [Bradyrhizobium sp. 44]|jgi:hypothetical protein|uniref:hypothetical protein n=1 Tax=unclassified Bradyrhizobium TaxID=2631580 RepID=UPI0012DBCE22|nr:MULTISPECIES: hypothetical protein [unclassified Bradyrhizobium]MCK1287213.1 hypothetical protein [Bradyrhizobium sp. 44]